ncbi:AmmeMemoRadiSam system protein B [Candidatus Peregrinibacteria bacterium]|nr:AmmeMemoRadiSam system protein B [Candidatus Peregrinibacteria bacterium]
MENQNKNIRKAEFAGLYYPSDAAELRKLIEISISEGGNFGPDFSEVPLHGMIVPSAGFSYGGKVAASAYQRVIGKRIQKIFLLGQSHFMSFAGVALSEFTAFESPLGLVEVDLETVEKLKIDLNFAVNEKAFMREYSIESQLPFLEAIAPDARIVPMMLGNKVNYTEVSVQIAELMGEDSLVVLSTNLSHYLSDEKARSVDQTTINAVLAKDSALIQAEGQASSIGGLVIMNEIATLKNWSPVFVKYANSSESGDGKDSVVGYAGVVYVG